jgi:hypothetical protein
MHICLASSIDSKLVENLRKRIVELESEVTVLQRANKNIPKLKNINGHDCTEQVF